MEYFKKMTEFIEKFNAFAKDWPNKECDEFFEICELEMAKAFLSDSPEVAVRVSKIILALKDVNEIKIKVE
jgi:hypothetical protein